MYIRTGTLPAFENERGQYIYLNPDADVIPLIIFMNENIGDKDCDRLCENCERV